MMMKHNEARALLKPIELHVHLPMCMIEYVQNTMAIYQPWSDFHARVT